MAIADADGGGATDAEGVAGAKIPASSVGFRVEATGNKSPVGD